MRKTIIILLGGLVTLSAVEWETEQINSGPNLFSTQSSLALDSEGSPRILFFEGDTIGESLLLRVAYKTTDSWEFKDVSPLGFPVYAHSIDVDSKGNTFVSYIDMDTITTFTWNLFLASDSTGDFVSRKLDGDTVSCYGTVVKAGKDGTVHLVYATLDERTLLVSLLYGQITGDPFQPERASDVLTDAEGNIDLVLVNDIPHVFFMDTDGYIQHASKSLIDAAGWDSEKITDVPCFSPTAEVDGQGKLHLAYIRSNTMDSIFYATNMSASWEHELAASNDKTILYPFDLALDPQGDSHLAWTKLNSDYINDIFRSWAEEGEWNSEPISNTMDTDKGLGLTRFFMIDKKGYGHTTYTVYGSTGGSHVYYAKTKTPLAPGIFEDSPPPSSLWLEVKGSRVFFSLSQPTLVRLSLYDAAGSRVQEIASDNYPAGEHVVPINTVGLASGVYFVRVEGSGLSASAKFVMIR